MSQLFSSSYRLDVVALLLLPVCLDSIRESGILQTVIRELPGGMLPQYSDHYMETILTKNAFQLINATHHLVNLN